MAINYKILGKKIRDFRVQKGLSQEELAEACNLSTSYISYIETGKKKINFAQLEKIAKKLNFTIDINSRRTNVDYNYSELLTNCSEKEKEFLYKVIRHIKTELATFQFDSQS